MAEAKGDLVWDQMQKIILTADVKGTAPNYRDPFGVRIYGLNAADDVEWTFFAEEYQLKDEERDTGRQLRVIVDAKEQFASVDFSQVKALEVQLKGGDAENWRGH